MKERCVSSGLRNVSKSHMKTQVLELKGEIVRVMAAKVIKKWGIDFSKVKRLTLKPKQHTVCFETQSPIAYEDVVN